MSESNDGLGLFICIAAISVTMVLCFSLHEQRKQTAVLTQIHKDITRVEDVLREQNDLLGSEEQ